MLVRVKPHRVYRFRNSAMVDSANDANAIPVGTQKCQRTRLCSRRRRRISWIGFNRLYVSLPSEQLATRWSSCSMGICHGSSLESALLRGI